MTGTETWPSYRLAAASCPTTTTTLRRWRRILTTPTSHRDKPCPQTILPSLSPSLYSRDFTGSGRCAALLYSTPL